MSMNAAMILASMEESAKIMLVHLHAHAHKDGKAKHAARVLINGIESYLCISP